MLVALILAGLAAWAVWNYLQNVEKEVLADQKLVEVFRAASPISEGTDGDILVGDFNSQGQLVVKGQDQAQDVPVGAITTEEQLRQVLGGKVAAGPIAQNSILTESQWVEVTVDIEPLATKIPAGKQAMTISVDNVKGVNGFVEPGDRVNMILTIDLASGLLPDDFSGITVGEAAPVGEDGAAAPEAETKVVTYTRFVLQGIPVLATGRDIRSDQEQPERVEVADPGAATAEGGEAAPEEPQGNATIFTLEVTPEQAERIAYAFDNGSVWLTLVPGDFVEVETSGVIIDNLFGGDLLENIFGN